MTESELPHVLIDADGYWWRYWSHNGPLSMTPTTRSNARIPHPVKRYRLVPIDEPRVNPPGREVAS